MWLLGLVWAARSRRAGSCCNQAQLHTHTQTHTWRHDVADAACSGKRLLRKRGVVGVKQPRVPAAIEVQPRAHDIQDVGLIHQQDPAVGVAAAPHRALAALLLGAGRVARLGDAWIERLSVSCVWERCRLVTSCVQCKPGPFRASPPTHKHHTLRLNNAPAGTLPGRQTAPARAPATTSTWAA